MKKVKVNAREIKQNIVGENITIENQTFQSSDNLPSSPSSKERVERLIANHVQRLQKLQEQQALHGINTDPAILIEIDNIGVVLKDLNNHLSHLNETATKKE